MDSTDKDSSTPSLIALRKLPSQVEVQELGEDWTGLTNPEQRKRLQNRLNQRAYRRRKKAQHGSQTNSNDNQPQDFAEINEYDPEALQDMDLISFITGGHRLAPNSEKRIKILNFAQRAYQNYSSRTPRVTHLFPLIRFNVLHALDRNAEILGFRLGSLCADELISPFNLHGPSLPASTPEKLYPDALRPSGLQISMVHHPWSDLLPFPALRDNLLRAVEAGFDEDELCADLMRVDENYAERACLIVWGDPWDVRAWEASIPFLNKWGWLVQGCSGLLVATNYWRERRGEKRLQASDCCKLQIATIQGASFSS